MCCGDDAVDVLHEAQGDEATRVKAPAASCSVKIRRYRSENNFTSICEKATTNENVNSENSMSGLVGYASSDEDDDIQPSKPAKVGL